MLRTILIVLLGTRLIFGQIYLTQPSVAAVDDPLAVNYNPAGLAFNDHTETMLFGHFNGNEFTKDFAYYSQTKNSGFAYQWDVSSAANIWSFSQGIKLSDSHALGFTYSYNDSKWQDGHIDLGWMYRPLPLLAVGTQVKNIWSGTDKSLELNGGLAFQNHNGRWGAGLEIHTIQNNSGAQTIYTTGQAVSAFLEPVEGFRINAYIDLGNNSNAGISLSFLMPEFGIESHGISNNLSSQTIGLRITANPYRSVFDKKPVKKDRKTYIRLKMDGLLIEEPEIKKPRLPFSIDFDIPFIGNSVTYGKQLKKFIDQINTYTDDPGIQGMIIDLENIRGGFSKISEVRKALQHFHDTGKKIIVYSKFGLTNATTYLLSMADEIYSHDMAGVDLRGLAMEITFFRGFLDTLSIVPEVWRVSPYKTAADPYLRDNMSEAMRSNYTQLLDGVYHEFVKGIAQGKGWDQDKTREIINNGPYLLSSEAISAGLLTGTMYPDEFEDYIKELENGKINIIKPKHRKEVPDYQYDWRDDKVKDKIAVIYAVGGIVSGKSKPGPSGSKNMGDVSISKAIKSAREDKSIKAIILRIDSGGGSALASDIMWREVLKTTETDSANIKPFIASMSDVAASGGYYIACQADSIIAYPSTITGSIGVIGMRLNYSQLKERFGIHSDAIKQGNHSDFSSGNRLTTQDESEMILASINDVYIKFKERVLRARDAISDMERLDSLALGRVWTGTDALSYGLIDEVGGYYDAIKMAKNAAGITGDIDIVELPDYKSENNLKKLLSDDTQIDLATIHVLESIKVLDLIPILQGGEIQMIMPVKIDIK